MTADAPDPHEGATLTVDLDAIVGNWRRLQDRLASGCRAAAVVKADGYGLGALPVAAALAGAGCQRFFVATADEGVALRGGLSAAEIIVLNGVDAGTAPLLHGHRLTPMLNSLEQATAWRDYATGLDSALPAALHIDTGMARLGLAPGEAITLTDRVDFRRRVTLTLVISHLACADQPDHPLNRQQLQLFAPLAAAFAGVESSLAASMGIFLGPEFHFHCVRPGAALYGINPTPGRENPMAAVARLQLRVLQVREIDAGFTVGYGATFRAAGKARLATVGAGYADGLLRSLGNRGHGTVGDKLVPLVGSVSMDLAVFDVSGVASSDIQPGAMIDLIGPRQSVDQLAHDAGTIGYEIFSRLGPRLARRYLSSAA